MLGVQPDRDMGAFVAKLALVTELVLRALDAGALALRRPRLARDLGAAGSALCLGGPSNEPLWRDGLVYLEARKIAADLPATVWQRLSVGAGAKGPRRYDWA